MSIVYEHFYMFCLWLYDMVKFAFLPYVLKLRNYKNSIPKTHDDITKSNTSLVVCAACDAVNVLIM